MATYSGWSGQCMAPDSHGMEAMTRMTNRVELQAIEVMAVE